MEILFWSAFLGACYSYALYPLLLLLLPVRRAIPLPGTPGADGQLPSFTLIIAARNEVERITQKLENAVALDCPAGQLQVLVASDASDDGTDQAVAAFADRGVALVRSDERLGKEHAQALAIARAEGDILVFSDAGTELPPDSLRRLAVDFQHPEVAAVSSEDTFISQDGSLAGEGAYVRYEMWLRRRESRVGSLVGLSGSFFAARRETCTQGWDEQIPSDFNTALNAVRQGRVAVTDPLVRGIYRDVRDPAGEYPRKVRTILRGITALARGREVLNPFRYGLFAWQVWSHKVMRWAVPWLLLGVLALNLPLAMQGAPIYRATLWAQLGGYSLLLAAWLWPGLRRVTLLRLGCFFLQVNLASAHALLAYLAGRRAVTWTPSRR